MGRIKLSELSPTARARIREALGGAGKVKPVIPAGKGAGSMNKTETAYARQLQLLVLDGEVQRWLFEPIRLRLGEGAWYTPDFLVVFPDGFLEFHEVKGFWREAALVRIKTAASLYPEFKFIVAKLIEGQWVLSEVKTRG